MNASVVRSLSRETVRELDRRAIEQWGIPSFALMESAGRACVDEVLRMLDERARGATGATSRDRARVHVLVGPGNNGADGLVIARTLRNRGAETRVSFLGADPRAPSLSSDFQTNLRLWTSLGGAVEHVAATSAAWLARCADAELVVDALFGTGLTRVLGEPWTSAIERVNSVRATDPRLRVLAVDIPSGLDADSGAVLGAAIRADATVTFIAAKHGFTRGEGPAHVGRVVVAEIGVPREWIEAELERAARVR